MVEHRPHTVASSTAKPTSAPAYPMPRNGPTNAPRTLEALLNTHEAHQLLGISARLLWTLTNRGEIPHVRIGRRTLYDPCDLRAWIQRRKSGGAR